MAIAGVRSRHTSDPECDLLGQWHMPATRDRSPSPNRTRLLLVRHGHVDDMDRRLLGRLPGVGLNTDGWTAAHRMTGTLAGIGIDELVSSPQPRALETAMAIACRTGLAITVSHAFDEMAFGAWSGQTFEALARDPAWRRYQTDREHTRAPGGESARELQRRACRGAHAIASMSPGRSVAIVTHAEVIRALVLQAMGLSLDAWALVSIPPASITVLDVHAGHRCLALRHASPPASDTETAAGQTPLQRLTPVE